MLDQVLGRLISHRLGYWKRTVLLVLMVPRIVPPRYIPTALGAHKSIESAGSTISLTLAGTVLDRAVLIRKPAHKEDVQSLSTYSATVSLLKSGSESKVILATPTQKQAAWNIIAGFFFVNFLSVCVILLLWRLDRRQKALVAREAGDSIAAGGMDAGAPRTSGEYAPIAREDDDESVEENKAVETLATDDDENGEVHDPHHATSYDMEPSTSGSHAQVNAAGLQTPRRRSSSMHSNTPLIPHDNSHSRSHSRLISTTGVPSGHTDRPRSITISRVSATSDILEHALAPSKEAIRRGKICFAICGAVITGAWVFYVTTLAQDVSRRRHDPTS